VNAGERRRSKKKRWKEKTVGKAFEEDCLRRVGVVEPRWRLLADAGARVCEIEITGTGRDWIVHWVQ
jgi:hypothetical protein